MVHKIGIISANLYGHGQNKIWNTVSESASSKIYESQQQALSKILQNTAIQFKADLICTQEDQPMLQMSNYPDRFSACDKYGEAMAIYGKSRQIRSLESFEIGRTQGKRPRCALGVTCKGIRVVNLFLPGGISDDQAFIDNMDSRTNYVSKVIHEMKPHIILGDFNADINKEKEETLFGVGDSKKYLEHLYKWYNSTYSFDDFFKKWIEWRHSPFKLLKASGYTYIWPKTQTSQKADLIVDGFFYLENAVKPKKEVIVFGENFDFSDHAFIFQDFDILLSDGIDERGEGGERDISPHRTPFARSISREMRKKQHTPPGICFRYQKKSEIGKTGRIPDKMDAFLHIRGSHFAGSDCPYTSWSKSAVTVIGSYAKTNTEGFIFVTCPKTGYEDFSSKTRAINLNKSLTNSSFVNDAEELKTWKTIKTRIPGRFANLESAKRECEGYNTTSGIMYDQVLITREAADQYGLAKISMAGLVEDEHYKTLLAAIDENYDLKYKYIKNLNVDSELEKKARILLSRYAGGLDFGEESNKKCIITQKQAKREQPRKRQRKPSGSTTTTDKRERATSSVISTDTRATRRKERIPNSIRYKTSKKSLSRRK
jgi:hypothetical protein